MELSGPEKAACFVLSLDELSIQAAAAGRPSSFAENDMQRVEDVMMIRQVMHFGWMYLQIGSRTIIAAWYARLSLPQSINFASARW